MGESLDTAPTPPSAPHTPGRRCPTAPNSPAPDAGCARTGESGGSRPRAGAAVVVREGARRHRGAAGDDGRAPLGAGHDRSPRTATVAAVPAGGVGEDHGRPRTAVRPDRAGPCGPRPPRTQTGSPPDPGSWRDHRRPGAHRHGPHGTPPTGRRAPPPRRPTRAAGRGRPLPVTGARTRRGGPKSALHRSPSPIRATNHRELQTSRTIATAATPPTSRTSRPRVRRPRPDRRPRTSSGSPRRHQASGLRGVRK